MPSSPEIHALSLHDALPIFREAAARERQAVERLSERAPAVLGDAGRAATAAVLDRIGATLRAAALTDDGRRLLETGRFTVELEDRKSTRLNSSHTVISYAVFPRDTRSFPTRRSSDLPGGSRPGAPGRRATERAGACGARRRGPGGDGCRARPHRRDAAGCGPHRRRPEVARDGPVHSRAGRSEEHTSELQSHSDLVCRLPPRYTLFPYTTLFRSSGRQPPGSARPSSD